MDFPSPVCSVAHGMAAVQSHPSRPACEFVLRDSFPSVVLVYTRAGWVCSADELGEHGVRATASCCLKPGGCQQLFSRKKKLVKHLGNKHSLHVGRDASAVPDSTSAELLQNLNHWFVERAPQRNFATVELLQKTMINEPLPGLKLLEGFQCLFVDCTVTCISKRAQAEHWKTHSLHSEDLARFKGVSCQITNPTKGRCFRVEGGAQNSTVASTTGGNEAPVSDVALALLQGKIPSGATAANVPPAFAELGFFPAGETAETGDWAQCQWLTSLPSNASSDVVEDWLSAYCCSTHQMLLIAMKYETHMPVLLGIALRSALENVMNVQSGRFTSVGVKTLLGAYAVHIERVVLAALRLSWGLLFHGAPCLFRNEEERLAVQTIFGTAPPLILPSPETRIVQVHTLFVYLLQQPVFAAGAAVLPGGDVLASSASPASVSATVHVSKGTALSHEVLLLRIFRCMLFDAEPAAAHVQFQSYASAEKSLSALFAGLRLAVSLYLYVHSSSASSHGDAVNLAIPVPLSESTQPPSQLHSPGGDHLPHEHRLSSGRFRLVWDDAASFCWDFSLERSLALSGLRVPWDNTGGDAAVTSSAATVISHLVGSGRGRMSAYATLASFKNQLARHSGKLAVRIDTTKFPGIVVFKGVGVCFDAVKVMIRRARDRVVTLFGNVYQVLGVANHAQEPRPTAGRQFQEFFGLVEGNAVQQPGRVEFAQPSACVFLVTSLSLQAKLELLEATEQLQRFLVMLIHLESAGTRATDFSRIALYPEYHDQRCMVELVLGCQVRISMTAKKTGMEVVRLLSPQVSHWVLLFVRDIRSLLVLMLADAIDKQPTLATHKEAWLMHTATRFLLDSRLATDFIMQGLQQQASISNDNSSRKRGRGASDFQMRKSKVLLGMGPIFNTEKFRRFWGKEFTLANQRAFAQLPKHVRDQLGNQFCSAAQVASLSFNVWRHVQPLMMSAVLDYELQLGFHALMPHVSYGTLAAAIPVIPMLVNSQLQEYSAVQHSHSLGNQGPGHFWYTGLEIPSPMSRISIL